MMQARLASRHAQTEHLTNFLIRQPYKVTQHHHGLIRWLECRNGLAQKRNVLAIS